MGGISNRRRGLTEAEVQALVDADTNLLHFDTGGEIAGLTEKVAPLAADWLLGEDTAAGNAKVKMRIGNVAAIGGGQTNTVAGANGIVNGGDNVDAILGPVYGVAANTICEGDDPRLSDSRAPNGSASGDLAGLYPNPTVDQSFDFSAKGPLSFDANITPPALSADVDDYAPTGWQTANSIHVSTNSGAPRTITGIEAPSSGEGEIKFMVNEGPGNVILSNNDAASAVANRFLFAASITLATDEALILKYDPAASRWRAASDM